MTLFKPGEHFESLKHAGFWCFIWFFLQTKQIVEYCMGETVMDLKDFYKYNS